MSVLSKSLADIKKGLEDAHKQALAEALIVSKFNLSKMSRGLEISRPTAYKYLVKFYGENFNEVIFKKLSINIPILG